jgi:hypothetical protein
VKESKTAEGDESSREIGRDLTFIAPLISCGRQEAPAARKQMDQSLQVVV